MALSTLPFSSQQQQRKTPAVTSSGDIGDVDSPSSAATLLSFPSSRSSGRSTMDLSVILPRSKKQIVAECLGGELRRRAKLRSAAAAVGVGVGPRLPLFAAAATVSALLCSGDTTARCGRRKELSGDGGSRRLSGEAAASTPSNKQAERRLRTSVLLLPSSTTADGRSQQ
nr:hypothetical protein Itr_chr13CG17470 [Ipomoea trifida]